MLSQVREILSYANEKRDNGEPFFTNPKFKPVPFSRENFHLFDIESTKTIGFVDGGNATIINSDNYCLGFIRVYYCIFDRDKLVNQGKTETFVLVTSKAENGKLMYKAKLFPLENSDFLPDEKDLIFDSMDETIREGIFMTDISKIISLARKFIEWKTSFLIRDKCDFVVRDGSLQTGITNEDKYAFTENIVGVAKTSSLFTTTGRNLFSVLDEIGPEGHWYYHPIALSDIDIIAVKLNKNSDHVFRLECKDLELKEVIGNLAANSRDYRFPGYPFGLLHCDEMARITDQETDYLRSLFMSSKKINDSHDILNKVVQ